MWDRAEAALRAALEATGLPYELKPGDGAFYGPKIDFDVADSIGRNWQLGTIQLDYDAPERFDLKYVGEDNHDAPAGGDPPRGERLVRALHRDPHRALRRRLPGVARAGAGAGAADQRRAARRRRRRWPTGCGRPGCASRWTTRNETLNYRIREGEMEKVPYMAVVGQREAESDSLALRVRGAGKKQEVLTVDAFLERVTDEVRTRALVP